MRILSLTILAAGLTYLFFTERRNRRTESRPWYLREYGRMNRDWIDRQLR